MQLLHRLLAKAIGRILIPPQFDQGSLGHVLLDGGELQAQGASQIAEDARMGGFHGDQRRRPTPLAAMAGSTSPWGRAMMWAATNPSPTRSQASAPARTAAFTAPVSPRTITVT